DQDVVVVLDAALLIEAGLADGVDVVIVTHSPQEIQVQRLAAKGMGERAASERIAAQLAPEQRLARADIVIDNSGSLHKVGRRVDAGWEARQAKRASCLRAHAGCSLPSMSRPPPMPDPLDCVLLDAGDTLLAPAP